MTNDDVLTQYRHIYDEMEQDVDNGNGARWHDIGRKMYDEAYFSFIERDINAAEADLENIRYGVAQCTVHATKTDIDCHLRSPLTDTLDEARHGEGFLQAFSIDPAPAYSDNSCDCNQDDTFSDMNPNDEANDSNINQDYELMEWNVTVIVAVHGGIDPAAAADACMMSHALRLESIPDDERFDRFSAVIDA